jgi:PBSX family phage terminase large subunit
MSSKSKPATRKEIQMNLLPAQRELVKSEAKIVCFVGGYGSGKTRGAVYKSIMLGLKNAPCFGIFIEPTFTMVRDVAVRSFEEVLNEMGMPFQFHKTDHIMRIADTFDVLFRSGDQPERLVGLNASWAVIDEPAVQDERVAKTILSRLRDPRAKLYQLALTGTPEGFNWFYEWCNKKNEDGTNAVHLIRAKTTDNPFLPVDYVEGLKSKYTPEEVNAYINGEFVRFEGGWFRVRPAVYPCRMDGAIKIFREPSQVSGQLVIGVDTAGGVDKDASAVVLIDKRDKSLVASWVDAKASIDEIREVVTKLFHDYTRVHRAVYPNFTKADPSDVPVVIVETNGIGMAAYRSLTDNGVPCVPLATKQDTAYNGLLLARNAVADGLIGGPSELANEADLLVVKDGKFEGPKDLSMAIGFCLNHIEKSPFITPKEMPNRMRIDFDKLLRKTEVW